MCSTKSPKIYTRTEEAFRKMDITRRLSPFFVQEDVSHQTQLKLIYRSITEHARREDMLEAIIEEGFDDLQAVALIPKEGHGQH